MADDKMIEQRLRFLEIDGDVIDDLQRARKILEPELDRMLDAFYARVLVEPQLKRLFRDEESVARARQAQKSHWLDSLLAGEFTDDQFGRADNVGRAHARVGVKPHWYIGGYGSLLAHFVEHILKDAAEQGYDAGPIVSALCKAIMLDLDLGLHSYLEAKDRVILDILMQATRFIDDLEHTNGDLRFASQKVTESAEVLSQNFSEADDQAKSVEQLLVQAKVLTERIRQLDQRIDELKSDDRLYLKRGTEHTGTFSQLVTRVLED